MNLKGSTIILLSVTKIRFYLAPLFIHPFYYFRLRNFFSGFLFPTSLLRFSPPQKNHQPLQLTRLMQNMHELLTGNGFFFQQERSCLMHHIQIFLNEAT